MNREDQSFQILKKYINKFPDLLIVLGSGWNKVLDNAKVETEISYKDLFGVEASVPGHEGKLVIAKVSNKRVAFMAGRLHTYEGYSAREATLPVRVFAQAGMKQMIVTSACGAIHQKYQVGDFVIANDLITLFLALDNPLVGPEFVDMSQVFDPAMRQIAIEICAKEDIPFQQGNYCYYHGPNFETPADKMALKILGADVVGMSTVPETIMARSLGIKVLAIPFVTNLAFVKHDHKDVLAAANKSSQQMVTLLNGLITQLAT